MYPLIVFQIAKVYSSDTKWPWLRMDALFVADRKVVNLFFSKQVFLRAKKLVEVIQNDTSFLNEYQLEMQREKKIFFDFSRRLNLATLGNIETDGLVKFLLTYSTLYRQHGVTPIRTLNKAGPEIVENYLRKRYSASQVADMMPLLLSSAKESLEQKFHKELLLLAIASQNLKKLQTVQYRRAIKKILAKYGWIQCGYANENALTERDILNRLATEFKGQDSPLAQLNKIRAQARVNSRARRLLLSKLHLPMPITRLVTALSVFAYYKDFIRMNYNYLHYSSKGLFKEVSRRLHLTGDDVYYLSVPEIVEALLGDSKVKHLIRIRKQHYVCLADTSAKIHWVYGAKALPYRKLVLQRGAFSINSFVGTVACPGKVRGKVKIIKSMSEAKNFPMGMVLVTPMTTPELVPAAKRASAIVTDEGGLTCHAAIISRELGKPCIVGTKVATRVLHNGDEVEVDAYNGIVKLL